MDFFRVAMREIEKGPHKGSFEVYPDFVVRRSKDLMVRGKAFHAIWDEEQGLWSTDEYDVVRLVDEALDKFAAEQKAIGVTCRVKHLSSFKTNGWTQFRNYVGRVSDNGCELDASLTFQNSVITKNDHASRRLPYKLESGSYEAWDELVSTLYIPEERAKIEWCIGSIVAGDSKSIQKFAVFYGKPGTGKSTIFDIIFKLFDGYCVTFDAKALVGTNNSFATEAFRGNPLVAIEHDSDLSKIEDNSKLNSIVSHEEMTFNEKYKPAYTSRSRAMLFIGTNKPVKITDAKAGIIRRLLDINPSGNIIPANHYFELISRINFELGAIAQHCLDVYRTMGKNYYNAYRPLEMMYRTDVFFNFVEAYYDVFKSQNGATLQQAYDLYREYCKESGIDWVLPKYKFRDEFKNYFDSFDERCTVDGEARRNYYSGFSAEPYRRKEKVEEVVPPAFEIDQTVSLLDAYLADCPAQYAKDDGTPKQRWSQVTTTLADLDTTKLHYVKVPENHIVIDFDLKEDDGITKSLERNIEAAGLWPTTYGERSKSGSGIHLHYNYTGDDAGELASNYAPGIEVKSFRGGASLRRRVNGSNKVPVAAITSGLPLKESKPVIEDAVIKSEKGLRDLIDRNLRKEIHPGTKPSVDFIAKILDDAYASGLAYDVTDLRSKLIVFANNSTNQSMAALKIVQHMKFKSEETTTKEPEVVEDRLVFFDVEVFPNLFVICWKYEGSSTVIRMINPTAQQVEALFKFKLVGFNNRRYDNHILWGAYLGYTNLMLYKLSKRIIDNDQGALFGKAYDLSYTDIYDFSSKKQSLKKFEIELGIAHVELNFPWDQPVPEESWVEVADYCANDVTATDAVFMARKGDWDARKILAELSGLSPNDTTQKHTAQIIFGDDRNPQRSFIYTDLSKEFDGYNYSRGTSNYRDETVGEGGYVYAEPGIYSDVALLDVASMHPTSIKELNVFGEYTDRFWELVEGRLAVKHKKYEEARTLLGGKLSKFLDPSNPDLDAAAGALAYALKIVVNIVYGLTSAPFDNPFRDPRNKDNIVAKRGSLFMIDLKHAVQERGFTVAHIKTDSIKIPNATPEIIQFVMDFGKQYGYTFEHEATYSKFCLVNDAVYIANDGTDWHAVGAQFQHPYVFKTLFNDADIEFSDLCEARSVKEGAMYLDFDNIPKADINEETIGRWKFVGRTGLFTPVKPDCGGGTLYRVKGDKTYAVTGTKGYFWAESLNVKHDGLDSIDMNYFETMAEEAIATIEKFGSFKEFVYG
jgi:hypothetical protein